MPETFGLNSFYCVYLNNKCFLNVIIVEIISCDHRANSIFMEDLPEGHFTLTYKLNSYYIFEIIHPWNECISIDKWCFSVWQFYFSLFGVISLTALSVFAEPPPKLPDLFAVLVSVYSCAHFILFLIYFHIRQFTHLDTVTMEKTKQSVTMEKTKQSPYTQLKKKQ